jgi:hypothetical protein
VIALGAGLAGCGSPGSPGSAGPLAQDSAAAVIELAKAHTAAAQSVTVAGRPGPGISVDLAIVPGAGCTGTVTQRGTTSRLIVDGSTVYAHTAGMPANEWERGSAASQPGLAGLCQLATILAPLSASSVAGAARSVAVHAGQPALTLSGTDPATGKPVSVTVTDTAEPVMLSITGAGGSLSFTGYGATKKIEPPSAG